MTFQSLSYYKSCTVDTSQLQNLYTIKGVPQSLSEGCGNALIKKLKENKETGCWEFNGCTTAQGYGMINIGPAKQVKAHRLAYFLFNQGEDPGDMFVLHSCDNPMCCSPFHLSLGTAKQNAEDMVNRGRHRNNHKARGEAAGKTKFSDEQVVEIIIRYEQLRDYTAVAREFDTTRTAIRGIVLSKTRGLDAGIQFEDLKGDADLSLRETIKPNIVQNLDAVSKREDRIGDKNGNSKLNWDLVNQIREDYKTVKNGAELARRYNVSKVLIGLIIKNKIWKTTEPIEQRKLQYTLDELAVIKERYRVVGSLQKVADELDIGRNKLTALLALAV